MPDEIAEKKVPEAELAPEAQDSLYLRLLGLAASAGGTARHYAGAVHASYTRGHGVAAEHASCLLDKAAGRAVEHLGGNNALNGADRKVAGLLIQTKYCASGSRCIAECFDASGFCYRGPDGMPMQIEVPKDLHESALQAMEHRIRTGQVSGVAEPEQARQIVRRGHLTYEQARNLGRAGKVESLLYDSATGVITAVWPLGLSSGVRFAQGLWQGEEPMAALGEAAKTGFGVGGMGRRRDGGGGDGIGRAGDRDGGGRPRRQLDRERRQRFARVEIVEVAARPGGGGRCRGARIGSLTLGPCVRRWRSSCSRRGRWWRRRTWRRSRREGRRMAA